MASRQYECISAHHLSRRAFSSVRRLSTAASTGPFGGAVAALADCFTPRIAVLTTIVLGALSLFAGVDHAHATAPLAAQRYVLLAPGSGPLVKGTSDLEHLLKELEEETEESACIAPPQGQPLNSADRTLMHENLDRAQAIIDQILDPAQHPSLTPSDAGEVDTSVVPLTLEQYADDTAGLAESAYLSAATGPSIDDELIGTNLKTIESLLAGYRDEIDAAPSE